MNPARLGVLLVLVLLVQLLLVLPLLAVVLVVLALAGAGYSSHLLWFRNVPYIDPSKVEEAATARTYLDAAHIAEGRPVVFLVGEADGSYTALMSHMIRSVLPAPRIDDAYIYVGSPENYLARERGLGQRAP